MTDRLEELEHQLTESRSVIQLYERLTGAVEEIPLASLRGLCVQVFDVEVGKCSDRDFMVSKLAYHFQKRWYVARSQWKLRTSEYRRRTSEWLKKPFPQRETEEMAKKKSGKTEKKDRKPTICSMVCGELAKAKCPTNEEIIDVVRSVHPNSKINDQHIAWYKAQYRQGKFGNKVTVIHDDHLARRSSKKAEKKTAVKGKKGKKGKKLVQKGKKASTKK